MAEGGGVPAMSLSEAKPLLDSGDWIEQTKLVDRIPTAARSATLQYLGLAGLSSADLATPEAIKHRGQVQAAFRAAIADRLEQLDVKTPVPDDPSGEIYAGRHKILRLVPTGRKSLFPGLALFVGVLALPHATGVLLALEGLLAIHDIHLLANALVGVLQKLKDPKQQVVFETVYALHAELALINHDKQMGTDHSAAYGHLRPDVDKIAAAISAHKVPDEVVPDEWSGKPLADWRGDLINVLEKMKHDKFLDEDKYGRWAIVV